MEIIQEVTDWTVPNHTYYLQGGKLIAYDNAITRQHVRFSRPLFFDKRRRKFKKVDGNMGREIVTMQMCEQMQGVSTEVKGSKGDTYYVSFSMNGGMHCTCKGFEFRGKCKHIETEEFCQWHQQWSDEIQKEGGVCPRCGGPTVGCRVMV